jgi:hypothetical protein
MLITAVTSLLPLKQESDLIRACKFIEGGQEKGGRWGIWWPKGE